MTRLAWRVKDDNPWDQIKCDNAQDKLLTWLEINWKPGMNFYDMLQELKTTRDSEK
jgi:hypothetical protein